MGNEKLRTINQLQLISLSLTLILSFVPAEGHNDYGKFYGFPLQSWSYHGGGMDGISQNMLSMIVNFLIIYYFCKIGLKIWILIFKRK